MNNFAVTPTKLGPLTPEQTMEFYGDGGYTAGITLLKGFLQLNLVAKVAPGTNHKLNIDLLRNDVSIGGKKARSVACYAAFSGMQTLHAWQHREQGRELRL